MIENLIRNNIRDLQPYSCAREEFEGLDVVFMDANENPNDTGYNRYPDPFQRELKNVIARVKDIEKEKIILGNGSDELIDMLIRTVCEPAEDNIIVFTPGYSMYEVSANINNVAVKKLNLDSGFQPDWDNLNYEIDENTKLIFFCTPNNPVGNTIPFSNIDNTLKSFKGLVVIDEAYIDFSDGDSAIVKLKENKNLVVLQTLSKAWGMAGLRLGICFADKELIRYLNKVKPPYNINVCTQRIARELLEDTEKIKVQIREIKLERERLMNILNTFNFIDKIYPSEANFILIQSTVYKDLYQFLIQRGIIVRVRNIPPLLENSLRITVSSPQENDLLISSLKEFRV